MYYGQCDEYREYSEIWSPKAKEVLDLASQKKIKCRRSWAVNTLLRDWSKTSQELVQEY